MSCTNLSRRVFSYNSSLSRGRNVAANFEFFSSARAQYNQKHFARNLRCFGQSTFPNLCQTTGENGSDWKNISKDFEDVWNMKDALGAIDGKHIAMDCHKGSLYYNYNSFHLFYLQLVLSNMFSQQSMWGNTGTTTMQECWQFISRCLL